MATASGPSWNGMPLEVKQLIVTTVIDIHVAEQEARMSYDTGPPNMCYNPRLHQENERRDLHLLHVLRALGRDLCKAPLRRATSLMAQKDENAPAGCRVYFRLWNRLDDLLTELEKSPKATQIKKASTPGATWTDMPLEIKQMVIKAFLDSYIAGQEARRNSTRPPIGTKADDREMMRLLRELEIFGRDVCEAPLQQAIVLMTQRYRETEQKSHRLILKGASVYFRMWKRLDKVLKQISNEPNERPRRQRLGNKARKRRLRRNKQIH